MSYREALERIARAEPVEPVETDDTTWTDSQLDTCIETMHTIARAALSNNDSSVEIAELVSMPEIAEIIGVKLGTVHSFRSKGILPAPIVELGSGPIYRRSEIIAWHLARPGKGWRRAA